MATVVNRRAMSDADLIAASRTGDADAYAELYRRHEPAARAAALSLCRNRSDADDLVADAFVSMLRILQSGNGPDVAFRPYLLVALRNRFLDRTRRPPEDPLDEPTEELDLTLLDSAASEEDKMLAAAAFATLPERWQLVLWHTEIEGRKPAEVAPLIGLAPNAVAALAYRAREGLRQAYLQAHLQTPRESGCAECVPNLAAYVREGLSARDRQAVDSHLVGCESCRTLVDELRDTNGMLRAGLFPVVTGVTAAKYLGHFGRHSLVAWFTRLSRLQQVSAAGSAAAAAVVAGVITAAVVSPGAGDRIIAEGPGSNRSATTVQTTTTTVVRLESVPTTVTTIDGTTTSAETTVVASYTTAPLGAVNRVPNRTVSSSSTSTTAAPISSINPATTTSTTVAGPPRLAVASVQIGVGLLGGQLRVGLTVSASSLPIVPGARGFANAVVSVALPTGVQLAAVDNPAWTCTAQGACTIASLTTTTASTAVLTFDVAANVVTPISFSPVISNPPGAVVDAPALAVSTDTVSGLLAQRYDRGAISVVGDTVCAVVCVPVISTKDLTVTGTVTKAVLVWSGVSNAGDRDQVKFTVPGDVVDVSADQILGNYSTNYSPAQTYVASADVTSLVTGSGTYGVGNVRTSLAAYGGWSLIVMTHDDTQPLRSLMIATPLAYVDGDPPYAIDLGGAVVPTSDVHLVVSAFEGTSSLQSGVSLNGFTLADPFAGLLSSGVDVVDATAVDVGAGTGTVTVSAINQALMLAAVGVAVDLS